MVVAWPLFPQASQQQPLSSFLQYCLDLDLKRLGHHAKPYPLASLFVLLFPMQGMLLLTRLRCSRSSLYVHVLYLMHTQNAPTYNRSVVPCRAGDHGRALCKRPIHPSPFGPHPSPLPLPLPLSPQVLSSS